MAVRMRGLLIGALLTTALLGMQRPVAAQRPPGTENVLLPPPRDNAPAAPFTALGPPTALPPPAPSPSPFSYPPQPSDTRDPIYQPRDPGPAGWGPYEAPSMPTSFFALHEGNLIKPHLKAVLTDTVPLPGGGTALVQPPTTQPKWTGVAAFEVGWTMPNSLGFFAVNYRGFASDGRSDALGLDGTTYALRSRLDMNQVGFDYGVAPYAFAPHWETSGRIGIALADVYFDNRAQNAVLTQFASNNYLGAGPHVRFDVWRRLGLIPGLSLYGRADLVVLVGQIHQNYTQATVNPDGSTTQGTDFLRKTQTVPVFTVEAGLAYTPRRLSNWRFTGGYLFEEWWFLGQIDGTGTRGQFNANGLFLRGEKRF